MMVAETSLRPARFYASQASASTQRSRLPIVFALAITGSGCLDETDLSTLIPDIQVSPDPDTWIAFTDVVIGPDTAPEARPVTVRNVGLGPLELRSVRIRDGQTSPSHRENFAVRSFPEALSPGQEAQVFVEFVPTATGTLTSRLVFESNDPDEPEVALNLRGFAKDRCRLEVRPAHQVFALNETRAVTLTVVGAAPCQVTRITTDGALFTLFTPALPFTIAAGAETRIDIQHTATTDRPGDVIRQLRVREAEGTETIVSLEGERPIFGCLEVAPSELRFGVVDPDETAERSVEVRNRCDRDATVVAASVNQGEANFSILDRLPMVVPGQGEIQLAVQYRPSSELGDFGLLVLRTDDAQIPRAEVTMTGEAARALLDVFPTRLNFGTVSFRSQPGITRSECSSTERAVQVFSSGSRPVLIQDMGLEPDGDEFFQIASVLVNRCGADAPCFAPLPSLEDIELFRGDEMRVNVVFSPSRADPARHEARLILRHDFEGGRTEIRMVGDAGDDGARVDVFRQLPGPKVDILWVIDNSISMADEQAQLITNLSRFVELADQRESDYRMAVTTSDTRAAVIGRLTQCPPHPLVIRSDYRDRAQREAAFRCMFDVGLTGHWVEASWGPAKKVLERALGLDPNFLSYAALLREDANLVVVGVSDEPEQSFESDAALRDFFWTIKGRRWPERFTAHAIARPNSQRYAWMTAQTGGMHLDITATDWSPILEAIAESTFIPIDAWPLSGQANPATLSVTVAGAAVNQDPGDGWTFDPLSNVLTLNGVSLPEPGAEIRVSYQPLCRP